MYSTRYYAYFDAPLWAKIEYCKKTRGVYFFIAFIPNFIRILQNMKEILDFKKLLKTNFDEYIKIYIGTLLGVVLKKSNIEDNDILLGYLYATNKIKKLAEIKKYNLPIIGVCNYTPSSIHNTGASYTKYVIGLADDLSGYITLTSGLNELYNKQNRADLTIEGVLENKFKSIDTKEFGKYIFFYGDLSEKYGVYELIDAFNELNKEDINLVLAGYHANNEKLNKIASENQRIKYLKMISSDYALSLMNDSVLNIDPRPYSEDFDRYIIPNIVLDYLNSNSLTLSVKNRKLQSYFNDDALWINTGEKEDLIEGINNALEMSKEKREAIIKKANADANKMYAMSVINHKVILFLKQFLKQRD